MTFQTMFKVYGEPVAKGRPRFTRQGRAYTPKKTHDYESEVAMMAKAAMGSSDPLETPVAVFVHVTFPIPQSYSKKRTEACLNGSERHTKRPDLDNCVKAITDGMNGIVYQDDSQITSIHATKVYGSIAMVEVMVKEDLL
jgi:Holliday junction resolvase RusA-like endonuclease